MTAIISAATSGTGLENAANSVTSYFAAHDISSALGEQNSAALPMFHSFTGCDTVSSLNGKGKKSAWDFQF